jgi:hypothetical protein
MGLDIVEYVMTVEDLFDVRLPDAELRAVRTPRQLARVVQRQLPQDRLVRVGCLSQRAFYRVRTAVLETHPDLERRSLRPATVSYSLKTRDGQQLRWPAVGERLGFPLKDTFSSRWLQLGPSTLGTLAERVVAERPATLRNSDEGWVESQIAEILLRVVEREQGLEPQRFDIDSEFVHDMGMD